MSGELYVDTIISETELTVSKDLSVESNLTVKEGVTLETLDTIDTNNITGNEHLVIRRGDSTLAQISPAILMPAGTILPFGGINIPEGWLPCDGIEYAKADYPKLYDAIETLWGGNAAAFNVPDLRGQFLRGTDFKRDDESVREFLDPGATTVDTEESDKRKDGTGTEVGSIVGSIQEDVFKGHHHQMEGNYATDGTVNSSPHSYFMRDGGVTGAYTDNGVVGIAIDDSYNSIPISTETRPKNVAVNYIIKY